MNEICYICGKPCSKEENNYHRACSKKMFGTPVPPSIPFSINDLKKLATQFISQKTSMTGVQKKLSLSINRESKENKLTFVGLWGDYILKPQVEHYRQLPENEFLTMCLADLYQIRTVPHALLPLASGELAYITKRIDRSNSNKVHMEDMAQLLQKMTEDKYRASVEQIGKIILKHCENRVLDALHFYELVS
ncbi:MULTISPECIES: HipA domain-containing protein [unclassified Oceanispirochaeta]|uniref:HipA domain-containing protein n=1 Tax=unclassified Oceanispirochaeta TaxID=2635722 RepID=UPI0013146708|nr:MULTISPECIES: HipA domain-containing protein [unclassified Oceanispirochaeta]MBF9018898.1 HipA domain-containing protein [Oceanispirochaeta sp. M2]NPD75397.1 HipA domain-containing protein [Oceanispirochaeta sp. M1]